ncbi:MAG: hypothetical protein DYG92_00385 [Leptolyngbya sp. PLA1]|nr:hypothetical protein [Leptolyngbya sp. PLA1]
MKYAALLVIACAGTSALADVGPVTDFSRTTIAGAPTYTPRDAFGIFGARMAVFSPAGGAFYDDAGGGAGPNLQNFGVDESMGLFAGRDIRIVSSQTILSNGNQIVSFDAYTADGLPFVPNGATVGGQIINAIQFDIGTPNAPADPVDFNTPITVVGALFTVSSASSTFGPFAPTTAVVGGNGLTVRAGVQAGTNITTFGLNHFHVEVEIQKIPAPGALALMGLGGLIAGRRRR